jgi:hypothetical protein
VGDVVLRRDEAAAEQNHKYAHVVKVHNGSNGMVRSTDIKYKLPGEEKFRVTTYPFTN